MTALIPADVHLAARRGFIRTASQSLATGFVIPGGLTFAFTQEWGFAILVAFAGVLVSAIVNGAQSYFSLISNGIPLDYAPETPTTPEVVSAEVGPAGWADLDSLAKALEPGDPARVALETLGINSAPDGTQEI